MGISILYCCTDYITVIGFSTVQRDYSRNVRTITLSEIRLKEYVL